VALTPPVTGVRRPDVEVTGVTAPRGAVNPDPAQLRPLAGNAAVTAALGALPPGAVTQSGHRALPGTAVLPGGVAPSAAVSPSATGLAGHLLLAAQGAVGNAVIANRSTAAQADLVAPVVAVVPKPAPATAAPPPAR
jgi:hypothetical protein